MKKSIAVLVLFFTVSAFTWPNQKKDTAKSKPSGGRPPAAVPAAPEPAPLPPVEELQPLESESLADDTGESKTAEVGPLPEADEAPAPAAAEEAAAPVPAAEVSGLAKALSSGSEEEQQARQASMQRLALALKKMALEQHEKEKAEPAEP